MKSVVHSRRRFRIDPDDFNIGIEFLDGDSDARDQTATADGRKNPLDCRQLPQDFLADRACAGDHLRIVVRRYPGPARANAAQRFRFRFVVIIADEQERPRHKRLTLFTFFIGVVFGIRICADAPVKCAA